MAKRFIDTDIWTQNKWFRKLEPRMKLFWFYLISNCDAVGVWEEDLELASFIIKCEYTEAEVLKIFGHKIKVFADDKKWWIRDFCDFQYGELQDDPRNRPHTSYINLLKKHSLYIDYKKTIHSPKDKDKEKEKDKDKDKEKENTGIFKKPTYEEVNKYCQEHNYDIDPGAFIDFYESKGWMIGKNKMKSWKHAVSNWARNDNSRSRQKRSLIQERYDRAQRKDFGGNSDDIF